MRNRNDEWQSACGKKTPTSHWWESTRHMFNVAITRTRSDGARAWELRNGSLVPLGYLRMEVRGLGDSASLTSRQDAARGASSRRRRHDVTFTVAHVALELKGNGRIWGKAWHKYWLSIVSNFVFCFVFVFYSGCDSVRKINAVSCADFDLFSETSV